MGRHAAGGGESSPYSIPGLNGERRHKRGTSAALDGHSGEIYTPTGRLLRGRTGRSMKPATTISKVCRVLGEFRQRPSLGVTDLARRTGLLPSDVHRILASLKFCGFIEQNPQTKTYRLGVGLMKLGLAAFQRNEPRDHCRRAFPKSWRPLRTWLYRPAGVRHIR